MELSKEFDTIVKIQKPILGSQDMWLIYDERREHVCHLMVQSIPPIVRLHMKHSYKEFFKAKWDPSLKSFILGDLVDWETW